VPKWYFLPYDAMLRAIPSKLLAAVALFTSIHVAGAASAPERKG
jgi:quinol-cytochrome oxidoreductase complex cytochrome b subunit